MPGTERHIAVQRTARYYLLGNADTARELWIVLHGYGQLARYFLHSFEGMEEGRLIVAPEGLSRFYLDGSFGRVGATWMTREDRENEIGDQVAYLDQLVGSIKGSNTGITSVKALGFSQGVATLCRWAALGKTRFDEMVIWGGSMPPDLPPETIKARWSTTSIHLVHGEKDTVVTDDVLQRNEGLLRSAGLDFRKHTFDGGHALDGLLLARLFGDQ